jgi:DNA-binding transcriptional LysR family regulator
MKVCSSRTRLVGTKRNGTICSWSSVPPTAMSGSWWGRSRPTPRPPPPTRASSLAAIAKAHPELAVDFVEMNTLQQVDALVDGRLDVGLAWMPPAHEAIASAVTARVGYVALLPVAHPLAARSVVSAAALADEPLITWPRAMNPLLYERFEAALNATGRPWSLVATASGFPNIVARVMSGHGIGVIPASAASARPLRGMAVVPLGEGGPLADRAIIWSRTRPHLLVASVVGLMRGIWRQRAGEAGYAASS